MPTPSELLTKHHPSRSEAGKHHGHALPSLSFPLQQEGRLLMTARDSLAFNTAWCLPLTGPGRETQHANLHDFYRAVDCGLSETLRSNGPLVPAGVHLVQLITSPVSTG
jgi:hypothetical protein